MQDQIREGIVERVTESGKSVDIQKIEKVFYLPHRSVNHEPAELRNMVQEIMFYPVSTKTFKFKVMFGTPGMRIVKEIILRNSGNKIKSFESSGIGKNFIKIASTEYQLKSKRIKYLYFNIYI